MGNQCFAIKEEEPVFQAMSKPIPCSRKKSSIIDWNSESSVAHRSAINCLHNYAIGKIFAEISDDGDHCKEQNKIAPVRKKSVNVRFRFSNELHQELITETKLLSLDDSCETKKCDIEYERGSPSPDLDSGSPSCTAEVYRAGQLTPAEKNLNDKVFNRVKAEMSNCSSAWGRSNFTESAPDFGVGQLFLSTRNDASDSVPGSLVS